MNTVKMYQSVTTRVSRPFMDHQLLLGVVFQEGLDLAPFIIENNVQQILDTFLGGDQRPVNVDERLGPACLLAFIQANFTGPAVATEFTDFNRDICIQKLSEDGEQVYPLVKYPWLLFLALQLCQNPNLHPLWHLRCLKTQQQLFENQSPKIFSKLLNSLETFKGDKVMVCIELSLIAQLLGKENNSIMLLEKACEGANFKHSLTGILGKKTKFQTFDVAQLSVQVNSNNSPAQIEPFNIGPTDIELQDEYLLDRPNLNSNSGELSEIGQAILLAECNHVLKFYAKDATINEKAMAFVQKILERRGDWSLFSSGLFLRSQLESTKARFIERAALQYEALVSQIKSVEINVWDRLRNFFISSLPSEWELDRCQARLFAGLGAFRTAANIYERREMWDEYVGCLIQLGERNKAIEILNLQLAKFPNNPKFLCILGDINEDPNLYQRAWEVSNQKYPRAMRSLGIYYVKKDDLLKAISSFESALAINGLFEKIWFLLGCAAIQVGDWRKALNAFSRTIAIDPDNSDAWNNLAAVHLQLNQPEEALKALKEAGKRQFENWKVWENIFRISLMLGELLESILAFRRVAEIKGKELDLGGFHSILKAFESCLRTYGGDDKFVKAVTHRISSLLDEVMATHLSMNFEFWYACADFASLVEGMREDQLEFLFKSYRAMQTLPVENDIEAFRTQLNCITKIQKTLEEYASEEEKVQERKYQYKTIVEAFLSKTRSNWSHTEEFAHAATLL